MNHFEKTGNLCRKIDIYLRQPKNKIEPLKYIGSTNKYKLCRDFIKDIAEANKRPEHDYIALFAKTT